MLRAGRAAGWAIGTASLALVALTATRAQEPETASPPKLYDELRAARLHHAGRVHDRTLRLDRFDIHFIEGHLYVLDAVRGQVTGAVFLGQGTVRAFPPDAVEHQQLRKILDADLIEDRFEQIVLRFSDGEALGLDAMAEPGPGADPDTARRLFEDQLDERFKGQLDNPDSHIAADLLERTLGISRPRDLVPYTLALIHGADHGWFSVEIDPGRIEEVLVSRYDGGFDATDVWMSTHALTELADESAPLLDPFKGFPVDPQALSKRREDVSGVDLGLPARPLQPRHERWTPQADLPLVTSDMAIDSRGSVKATAALLVEPLGERASFRFRISPWLHVTDVRWREAPAAVPAEGDAAFDLLARAGGSTDGTRDPASPAPPLGEQAHLIQERRVRRMTDDWFEPWVTVTLPSPIGPGRAVVLEFAYEGKLLDKLQTEGSYLLRDTIYWMPVLPDDRPSRFHMTFRTRERDSVVSSGDLLDDRVDGRTRIVRRVVRTPALHASFHHGRFTATTVQPDGLPAITVYEDRYRLGSAPGSLEKTIADLTGALRTGRTYFGDVPFPSLQATETPSTTGQAFPGFLLLASLTFGELHTGESELFRAHEVGHQWWGVGMNWRTYRDQWLSEGFAQYGAALYVRSGLDDERQFRDILSAWRDDVTGQLDIGQGNGRHYGFRPSVIRKSKGSASGALVVGYRLRTVKTPFDYRLLVYEKGAYILHMLRTLLLDPETRDDSRFRALMRTFAAEQMHRLATTGDFEAAVSTAMGESMRWFFDQWVYGVSVPTYRPDLKVVPDADGTSFRLTGRIVQEGVDPAFRMPVPIALRFADRTLMVRSVWVDQESVTVDLPLPARPTQIEFNYLDGVLARVR